MTGIAPQNDSRQTGEPGQRDGRPAPPRRDRRLGLVVARPFGIPVYVSPYWFVVAALLVLLYGQDLGGAVHPANLRYVVAAAFVLLLYVSVLVHELSHCVVARGFGLPVRRVLLYPLGGFSEIEKEPPTPWQEFCVSVAGPVTSLALAGIALALTSVASHGIAGILVDQLFRANLIVGVFNLLPGLPLDGGRIFRAGVWKITGKAGTATLVAAWAGRVLAVLIIGVPAALLGSSVGSLVDYYWIWLLVIAGFIWIQSGQAIKAARVRARLPGLQARALARRAIPVPADLPLAEAIRQADAAHARALVIVDRSKTPVAIVSENAVMATPEQRRPWIETGSLARALDTGVVLSADLAGLELIEAVQRSPASEYLLIEPSGAVYGVLAASDLDHAFAAA